jgi:hypothetical protein
MISLIVSEVFHGDHLAADLDEVPVDMDPCFIVLLDLGFQA